MITNSTLKFYLAVARGLWVVSSQWIVDSISAGKVVPEVSNNLLSIARTNVDISHKSDSI
jgi:hypothetical protein